MTDKDPREFIIDPAQLLPSCPKVQSSLFWPAPIDTRLSQLVDTATVAGERLSRADLLGALVLTASTNGETLGMLVRRYRSSRAGDAVLRNDPSEVIQLHDRRPGRRPAPESSSHVDPIVPDSGHSKR